jgi:hypothetical protein
MSCQTYSSFGKDKKHYCKSTKKGDIFITANKSTVRKLCYEVKKFKQGGMTIRSSKLTWTSYISAGW